MGNYDRVAIKLEAKANVRRDKNLIFLGLAFTGILFLLSLFTYFILRINTFVGVYSRQLLEEGYNFFLDPYGGLPNLNITVPSSLLAVVISLVQEILTVGFYSSTLKASRGQKVEVSNLFDAFGFLGRAVTLIIVKSIFIFLWSLLFVIPGIIAMFRYSMAYFIMLDNPNMTTMECLRESSRIMVGNKGRFFVLELSFLGWALLDSLISSFIFFPLLSIWLTPYMYVSYAGFYNHLISYPSREVPPPPPIWEQQ